LAGNPRKLLPRTVARRAALLASAKSATNIVVLDVRKVTDFTDYFVICTGAVDVHVKAIVDSIDNELRKIGWKPLSIEGEGNHKWVLMDYVDVIVHVFQPESRGYYSLERLWGDAVPVEIKGLNE
jgi:ribosome-associated protein